MIKHVFLLILALSSIAYGSDRVDAARDLAHANSVGDLVLMGNALANLKQIACAGDPQASAIIGRKYYSGAEEFQADSDKAKQYLQHAAEHAVPGAAVELTLLLLRQQHDESFKLANVWLRVAAFVEGEDSPKYQLASNAVAFALKARKLVSPPDVAAEAALIIHKIRNGLYDPKSGPCRDI